MPPLSSSGRFIFRAAGFIATRALGRPPGVRDVPGAKWIWNAETPARVPAGARISAGKRQRHQVVADEGGGRSEPVAGELYAVARIAGKADDDPLLFSRTLFKSLRSAGRSSTDSTHRAGSP